MKGHRITDSFVALAALARHCIALPRISQTALLKDGRRLIVERLGVIAVDCGPGSTEVQGRSLFLVVSGFFTMKLCRYVPLEASRDSNVRVGLVRSHTHLADLTHAGIGSLTEILESDAPLELITNALRQPLQEISLQQIRVLAPIERQEVWAAGVTYLRSKSARMEESEFSATAYDRVYDANRPEIFFKSQPDKVVGTGDSVGIRRDATWNVPEPELALVMNSRGVLVGCTIGNDMSSRDIEGENLLYLPQAKVYDRSCSLGPWIELGLTEEVARSRMISITIRRGSAIVFSGETSLGNIKRGFPELIEFLFRSQKFPHGAVLLTGTGIVPDESFTLAVEDDIEISVSELGTLCNKVILV